MLRHVATFILLGPLLVWLTIVILLLPDVMRRPHSGAVEFFGFAIVIVAVLGFVPAVLLACADHLMANRGLPRAARAAACAALGYPAAGLAFYVAVNSVGLRSSFADDVFIARLFGIIPAAVCSWLAGRHAKGSSGPS
jgi:hypothetical protein